MAGPPAPAPLDHANDVCGRHACGLSTSQEAVHHQFSVRRVRDLFAAGVHACRRFELRRAGRVGRGRPADRAAAASGPDETWWRCASPCAHRSRAAGVPEQLMHPGVPQSGLMSTRSDRYHPTRGSLSSRAITSAITSRRLRKHARAPAAHVRTRSAGRYQGASRSSGLHFGDMHVLDKSARPPQRAVDNRFFRTDSDRCRDGLLPQIMRVTLGDGHVEGVADTGLDLRDAVFPSANGSPVGTG